MPIVVKFIHLTPLHFNDKQFNEESGHLAVTLLSAPPKLLQEVLHPVHLESVRTVGDTCVRDLSDTVTVVPSWSGL